MDPITNFVVNGRFGQAFLGQTKRNLIQLLGEPRDWQGRVPYFGEVNETFYQSKVWYYHDGVMGVCFGVDGTITELILFFEKLKKPLDVFAGWPKTHGMTMVEWRFTLEKYGLPIEESKNDLNYWILSVPTCIACCWPFPNGNIIPKQRRPVLMIMKVVDPEMLMDLIDPPGQRGRKHVKGVRQRGRR